MTGDIRIWSTSAAKPGKSPRKHGAAPVQRRLPFAAERGKCPLPELKRVLAPVPMDDVREGDVKAPFRNCGVVWGSSMQYPAAAPVNSSWHPVAVVRMESFRDLLAGGKRYEFGCGGGAVPRDQKDGGSTGFSWHRPSGRNSSFHLAGRR